MTPSFDLQIDGERKKPGEIVNGTVVVREGGRSRSLEVTLEFVEETDDYIEAGTTISSGHLHEGDLVSGTSLQFALTLPPDALPEVRSQHGQMYWRLHAKSDERGSDTHEHLRLVVD